jgi:hypothetical protein
MFQYILNALLLLILQLFSRLGFWQTDVPLLHDVVNLQSIIRAQITTYLEHVSVETWLVTAKLLMLHISQH